MKTIKRTKNIITNYETLYSAWLEVRKSKTFSDSVIKYESNLAVNLTKLQKRLIEGTYKPSGYRVFSIYEPKERVIKAPFLEDRIVHHALLIVVGKLLDNKMISTSYACRIGKGTHRASELLKKHLVNYKNEGYCLNLDVKKFFYSISHEVLTRILRKHISCKFALNLFEMFYGDELVGIPLGNVTSQVFANIYLNEFDHFAKRKLKAKHYLRYMDDVLILHKDKKVLRGYLELSKVFIESLGIETNSKTKTSRIKDGIDFVGYRTWYNRRVIRKSSLFRIKRKLKKNANIQRISSFLSHSKSTNSLNYVFCLIKDVNKNMDIENFINKWRVNNENI